MTRENKIYFLITMLKEKFKLEINNANSSKVLFEKMNTTESDKAWFNRMNGMDSLGILDELREYANGNK